jgi:hypothetical protein
MKETPEALKDLPESNQKIDYKEIEFKETGRDLLDPTNADFVNAFVNAFGVNTVSPTSPEW